MVVSMPCSVSQSEIDYYEEDKNKKAFGLVLTDAKLLEEVACQATKFLYENKLLDEAPELVKKWFTLHSKKDKEK